jgi:hypothetical protein
MIEETAAPALKRQYPHVDVIADWRAQQSVRLLWDRVFDLEGRLQAAQSTITELTSRTNAQDDEIARAQRDATNALAQGQLTPGERAAAGGLQPGEPATGPGSKGEPIVPMSTDLTVMEGNIKASLYHWGRTDYSYWFPTVKDPYQGGDGKWYQGWSAYEEERAKPGNTGSADHALYPLPAVYTTAPPSGYPTGGWT